MRRRSQRKADPECPKWLKIYIYSLKGSVQKNSKQYQLVFVTLLSTHNDFKTTKHQQCWANKHKLYNNNHTCTCRYTQ